MSEYDGYDQPTHDEPTADYPPADQYDSLIGQPLDGGFDAPHHEQSVGGFTANDGYGPDHVNYGEGAEHGAGYAEAYGEGAEGQHDPAYAGAEGQHDPAYAGGDQHDPAYGQHDPAYAGGDQPEGYEGQYDPGYTGGDQPEGDPNYAADGGEYAQPTHGTSTSGTSAR